MSWNIVPQRTGDMAVHAVLLPGATRGEVLYFGGYRVDDTHRYDVEAQTIFDISANLSPDYNVFCSGHAFLADGRVLVAGGQLHLFSPNGTEIGPPPPDDPGEIEHAIHGGMNWGGERRSSIYSPLAGSWQETQPMSLDPAGHAESGGRWYPTLVTLSNGDVLAVGGHPDLREHYPSHEAHRHSNNIPERYSVGSGQWTLLGGTGAGDDRKTADDPDWGYDYQRTHLLPNGRVFFASPVRGRNRTYDPWAGRFFDSPSITLPADDKYGGISASWTSVMLPLLPQESHRPRVLLFGGVTAQRIDLGVAENQMQWVQAGNRNWNGTPPVRSFSCPVLLPTGQVFFSGGTRGGQPDDQTNCVREGELYTPGIDWNTGQYSGGESWQTVEAAVVGRHYHSVALLLPDGSVWTAGSNGPSDDPDTNHPEDREQRVEIWRPPYFDLAGRPTIADSPRNIGYGYPFLIQTPQAGSIRRVALIRCGSCTHGFNPDQRYIALDFEHVDGDTLRAFTYFDGNIAPPGYYLLWIVDDQGRPCRWAPFIRVSKQKCYVTADVSTFSVHEVDALGPPANFDNALYVVYDGFLPDEVSEPGVAVRWRNDQTVPGMSVEVVGPPLYEGNPLVKDVAQRIAYPIRVHFSSMGAFDQIPAAEDFEDVTFSAVAGDFECVTTLSLSKNANPRISDGNPHWLSIDLRVFKTGPDDDEPYTAGIAHGSGGDAPYTYIQSVLAAYNGTAAGASHPFESLPTEQESNRLALYSHDAGNHPIYNYGIARVRFRAPEGVDAAQVRVFFRQWTTGWTAMMYTDPTGASGSFRRIGDGPSARPLLGIEGNEINNIPCFAEARNPDMAAQTDTTNLLTLEGNGAAEVHAYFGCWLDFNQDVARFPLHPQGNGPYGGELLSIQELMRGLHQCLVAEIHYTPDPIPLGATPSSSDNIAQRNLLLDESDNPGGFASHLVHHTFELKPSPNAFPPPQVAGMPSAAASRTPHPDELAIHWGGLPRDSQVTLYLPQVDVDAVLRQAALRPNPGNLAKAGPGTLRLAVTGDACYVPLPGPLQKNIACLLSVQLPPTVVKGQRFHIVLRQVEGRRLRVLGATQFDIHVRTADVVRPRLERNLSVLRHIQRAIPEDDRWHPVFVRYLGELADRVRAMDGDPDRIEPSPAGDGRDPSRRPCADDGPQRHPSAVGKVAELDYDGFGDFRGFVIEDGARRWRFNSCEPQVERIVRRACRERSWLAVYADARCGVAGLALRCCDGQAARAPCLPSSPCLPIPCGDDPSMHDGDGLSAGDRDQLRVLSLLHLLFAGLGLLGLGAVVFHHVAFHHALVHAASGAPLPGMAGQFEWLYVLIALLCIAGIVLNALAAYCLRARRHRRFCLLVAALDMLQVPFGTLLGVFAFVLLSRERVRHAFGD